MAITQNTYTGNGSNKLFSITFPYLDTSDVEVYLNGTLQTAYTFANATTIEFVTAPANGATVLLSRSTDDTALQATFFPGSSIKAADLNYNFDQVLYLAQETVNFAANQSTAGLQTQITTATNTANTAITTATAANATANGIAGTANTALANSSAAVSTANAASVTANAISAVANAALPTAGGTMTGNLNVVSLNGGPIAGTRNRIINGDMRIDQRNAGAAVTLAAGDAYIIDRWNGQEDTDGGMTAQRSTTAPTGFTNSLLLTTTTADASLGATQSAWIRQHVEGLNVDDLAWGTANAKTITLSFWVRSSLTGTFGGSATNSSVNRSYPFTFAISSANTFEYKTITIPGDTTGTWLTDTGRGITIFWGLGVGSTYSGTASAWAGAAYFSATGATSVIGTNGATFYLTGVQLESGTVATPFERRSFGAELALCQRYFETSGGTGGSALLYARPDSVNICADAVGYAVEKRATPIVILTNSNVTPTLGINTTRGLGVQFLGNVGFATCGYLSSAEL
jgi:hypothetical protein